MKRSMLFTLAGALFLLTVLNASAASYYFAANGDDFNNNGLSIRSPWKGTAKLNEIMAILNPGDSVLLRRGDVFDGGIRITKSGAPGSVIYFGAYGAGAKPVLNGTKKVSEWKKVDHNKWEAGAGVTSGRLTNLFMNGVKQPLGRWPNITAPNRGYLPINWALGRDRLSSDSIPDGSRWLGADVVIKTHRWVLDRLTVSSASGDTLTLQSKASYEINPRFGFFINNHPSTLDRNGEWCFDKETGKITLYSETDPASCIIEVSDVQDLISVSGQSFVTIENLVLNGSVNYAITVADSESITVRNTEIVHAGYTGVQFTNCRNGVFEHNEVHDVNNQGLIFHKCSGTVIRRNEIRNIGLIPGMGTDAYSALGVAGSRNLVEYNKIDSIGYIALSFGGDSITIRHNVISNYCMVKDDGGAIYTWGDGYSAQGVERKIIGNIVRNAIGAGYGTGDSLSVAAEGIYIDDRCANVEITGNTVYNCGNIGIFIHNANQILMRNNLVFDNKAQLQMLSHGLPRFRIRSCVIKNNIFISRMPEQRIANFLTDEGVNGIKWMGDIDSNYYCRPSYPDMIMFCSHESDGVEIKRPYALDDWKAQYGHDKNSLPAPVRYNYTVNSLDTLQKITYGYYNEGEDVWYKENPIGKTALNDIITGLTGKPDDLQKGMNKNLILAMNIDFEEGEERKYLLRFEAKGEKPGEVIKVNFKTPDHRVIYSKVFELGDSFQHNEMLYIPSFANIPFERVNFEFSDPESAVWIRNITFRKADVTVPAPDDHFLFLVNESDAPRSLPVEKGFVEVSGKIPESPVILQPYSSRIFFKK